MCRWVAYGGPPIYLEDILFDQDNSLVSQSLSARESSWTTNGDGFGVAWYTERETAGLFKDILPAWNDQNLRSLAGHIKTNLFFAHVRATTGTAVNRSNCHPFIWRNWTFMHNGRIGGWNKCRKAFENNISSDFYYLREGTTDSEAIFLVALSQGLVNDPQLALERTIKIALRIMDENEVTEPLRASIAVTNGVDMWALRFSNDNNSPSLYYGKFNTRSQESYTNQFNAIASEPSDSDSSHWFKVEEKMCIHWTRENMMFKNFSI